MAIARRAVPRARFALRARRSAQRGWAGLVVALVALVIVAVLATEALKRYGLASGTPAAAKAGSAGERARSPGAIGAEAFDHGTAVTAPASALERARGVEDMIRRQADERAARGDGTGQ